MTKKVRLFLTMLFLTLLGGANAAWAADTWVKTAPSSLQTGDIVVIVDETSKKAMSNDNGASSAPTATAVTLDGDKITSTVGENIQWEVSVSKVNGTDYYSFKVYNTDNYLYCTNTNNGVRVGTSENTVFSIYNNDGVDFLLNEVTSRYLGVYNSQDWRCYSSINANIRDCVTSFYKKVSTSGPVDPSVTISAETIKVGKTSTISGPSGLDMQFESDDESVATVSDEGVVTGVAAGTATITATWSENDSFNGGSKEFTITVTDPNAPGTASNPYTVADAIAYINTLGSASSPNDVYVSGIISQVDSYNSKYHSITYWISDEGTTSTQMEVYSGKGLDGADFSSIADLQVGDIVTVCGVVKMYNTTPEFDKNNKLVSFERPASVVEAPVFTPAGGTYSEAQSVEITCAKENATIYYTIDGKDPTNESTEYTGAITVSETTTIKAIAYVGTDASQIASAKYTIEVPGEVVIVEDDKITFLFNTPANEWGFPVGSSNKLVNETEYTANGYTIKVAASSEGGFYYNNSGYLLLGKFGAHITLPAFNFPVSKIDVVGSSSASEAVRQNIFVNGAEVSKETTGAKNVTNSYIISSACQAAGNIYTLKVTNNYNTQVTKIIVYKGEELNVEDYYLVGSFNNWTKQDNDYKFTTTDGVTYTLADVEFDANTTFKVIDSVEGDNTTWYGGNTGDTNYKIHRDWCTDIETAIPGKDFLIETAGTYNFTFTIQDEGNPQISVTGWPEVEYYLTGDFNNWAASDDDYKFTKQNDGTYKLTTNISGNFKVYDSLNHKYGATADGSYWITADNHTDIEMTDQAANYYLETANDYTFIVNPDTKKLTVTGWPIVLDGNAFVKVTSTDELTDGAYLIVCEGAVGGNVAFDGSLENLDGSGNTKFVNCIDNRLIVRNDNNINYIFTISNGAIQSASGYYIGVSSNNNGLNQKENSIYTHEITFDEDGNAIIKVLFEGSTMTLQFNSTSGQERFRYFKSAQQPIALYKLQTVLEPEYTIGSTGYGTLYYGRNAIVIPEGVTAYTVSVENKEMTMTDVQDFIPKGTGVVLQGEPGTYSFMVIPGSEKAAPEGNMLLGFDEQSTTVGPNGETEGYKFYMLSLDKNNENVGFYYAKNCPHGEAFTSKKSRAYLAVPTAAAGAKVAFPFSEAAIVDGIGSVQSTMFNDGRMEIFNLNGQRVSTPQRGIYIINGKKVLVK